MTKLLEAFALFFPWLSKINFSNLKSSRHSPLFLLGKPSKWRKLCSQGLVQEQKGLGVRDSFKRDSFKQQRSRSPSPAPRGDHRQQSGNANLRPSNDPAVPTMAFGDPPLQPHNPLPLPPPF